MEPRARPDSTPPSTQWRLRTSAPVLYFPSTRSPGHRHAAVGSRDLQGPRVKEQTAEAEVAGGAGGLWDIGPETAELAAKGHLPVWSPRGLL